MLARKMVRILQTTGQDKDNEYPLLIRQEAALAKQNLEIKQGMELVKEHIQRYHDSLVKPEEKETEFIAAIKKLADAIEKAEFVDPEQAEQIHHLLETFLMDGCLTELGPGGKHIPMCDKTKFQIATSMALALGKLAKDQYDIDSSKYVDVDEVKIRIPSILNLAYRFILKDNERREFLDEFRQIWEGLRTKD